MHVICCPGSVWSGRHTFKANGTIGQFFFCTASMCGSFEVDRGAVEANASTAIFLSATTFDSNGNTNGSIFAFGPIPPSALQGEGTAQLSLNLDLSTASSLTYQSCANDPVNGLRCSFRPEGLIDVTWQKNGAFTSHTTGTLTESFSGGKFLSSGSSDNSSALAQGTILGLTINASDAEIGVQHDTTVTIELTSVR